MSKVIKKMPNRPCAHIVQAFDENHFYYVDSNETFDAGFETMAFPYDIEKNEVQSWNDVAVAHYANLVDMLLGHISFCEELEEHIVAHCGG